MDLSKITTKPDAISVVIEISANAEPVKYEFNKELGLLQVDRFLSTSMTYPCNYGF
ncbi:MAG: inorganic diphosphatase, partial [Wolbachia sp.]